MTNKNWAHDMAFVWWTIGAWEVWKDKVRRGVIRFGHSFD